MKLYIEKLGWCEPAQDENETNFLQHVGTGTYGWILVKNVPGYSGSIWARCADVSAVDFS